jgi:arrestin-related trafficking adapter 1
MLARLQPNVALTLTKKTSRTTRERPLSEQFNYVLKSNTEPHPGELLRRHGTSLGATINGRSSLAEMNIVVESPPLLSHGSPDSSSGALFSGQLCVNVLAAATLFRTLDIRLFRIITTKKSKAHHRCKECGKSKEELRKWSFTHKPVVLSRGKYGFPFNHVFDGSLPASTCSRYAMIDYQFIATAKLLNGETITHRHTIQLQRTHQAGNDMHSAKMFPPTSITASIQLNPTCFIGRKFPVSIRLSGLEVNEKQPRYQWKPKQLRWRIDEHQTIISPGCSKHHTKGGDKYEDVSDICNGYIEWKKVFCKANSKTGDIDANFTILMSPERRFVPDVQADDIQLDIWHNLIVDVLVEEYVPVNSSHSGPTGHSRFLRFQSPIVLTNHGGAAVAWDEEVPPVYQDATNSPPAYD